MGLKDTCTTEYISQPDVFADVFNYFLYAGKAKIRPEMLQELDTRQFSLLFGDDQRGRPIQRIRDNIKLLTAKHDNQAAYLALAIENQSMVHYAMPVRVMVSDGLQYDKQVQVIKNRRRSEHAKAESAAFLSGITGEDRLIPVITLVILWDADPWDGPRSLHEMLAIQDETLLRFIPDYRLNLVEPGRMRDTDFGQMRSDLRLVFQYIKYSKDKEGLEEIVSKDEAYRNMNRKTAELINAVTNSKLKLDEKAEVIDMCQAIAEMRRESLENGRAEGRQEGLTAGRAEGRQEGLTAGRAEGRQEGLIVGRAEGRQEGLTAGRAEGRQEGLTAGRAEGEDKLAKLIMLLTDSGRTGDIAKAAADRGMRERLYLEFGIS